MSFVPAPSYPKYALAIPWFDDEADQDEGAARNRRAENMRVIQRWANTPPVLLIMDITADGTTSSYTVPIPSGYTNLRYRFALGPPLVSADSMVMQFNGDTGNNYNNNYLGLEFNVAGVTGQSDMAVNFIRLGPQNQDAGRIYGYEGTIFLYGSSTFQKTVFFEGGALSGGGANAWIVGSGNWQSTAPITSIRFFNTIRNILSGSRLQMWCEY